MTQPTQHPDSESAFTAADYLKRPEYAAILTGVEQRKNTVAAMFRHARAHKLKCDEAFISRHYNWFYRWHTGIISTGYLIQRTGVEQDKILKGNGRWM